MSEPVKNIQSSAIDLRAYHPLSRLRWVIRGFVVVEGLFLAMILGCLWFWFSIALDFSLHHFQNIDLLDQGSAVRWIMMTIFAVGMTGIVLWYIVRRLFRDFRPASLALVLEKRFPELLGDRLITAVELVNLKKAEAQGYSVDMILLTMKDAKERVDKVPVLSVFNWWRLVVMAWSLVGVSVLILLLTYPVCMLFSLAHIERGPVMWAMLTINSLLVVSLLFVFAVPYLLIGMRKRRSPWRWALLGTGILCAATAAFSYNTALHKVNATDLDAYSWQFYHVTDIGLDRNLRFADTRWPRDEYFIDWYDFPVEEKRMQNKKRIFARSIFNTWIIADDKVPERWRPVKWNDLAQFSGKEQVPPLPLEQIQAFLIKQAYGDENTPVGFDKTKMTLPTADDITVDLALAAMAGSSEDKDAVDLRPQTAAVEKILNGVWQDRKRGQRLVRRVSPPHDMTLFFGNDDSKLRGRKELPAVAAGGNVYGKDPVQLDDSFVALPPNDAPASASVEKHVPLVVEANINGRTLKTQPRRVVLVSPPKVQTLVFQEFRPAYFYYLPPSSPRAVTIDERRKLLRDLRQPLPKMQFSSPAESYTLPLFPRGSEIAFTVTADKKLQEVTLVPRNLEFPGAASAEDLQPLPLVIAPDGRSFTIRFAADGKPLGDWHAAAKNPRAGGAEEPVFPLVNRTITFDVTLKDVDNMTSTRYFTASPIEDKEPTVNLFVNDVIRQVKDNNSTVYICTPKADIPFARESVVADETGLHKIEFTYDYSPIVNKAYMPGLTEQTAWLLGNTPVLPNIGDIIYRKEILQRNVPTMLEIIRRDVPEAVRKLPAGGSSPIAAFDNAQGKAAEQGILSIEKLKERLAKPLPADHASPVLKKFSLKDLDTPLTFDIEKALPQLREKNSAGLVPYYKLSINVRATDSNVQSDGPRTARNAESLDFLIVDEDYLYAFIAKEEAELVRRFDELITRLELQDKVLKQLRDRVRSLSPSTASFEQTRLEGIQDAVVSSRVTTAEIFTAYQRLVRERKANRMPDKLTDGLENDIVRPLESVQNKEFANAERELVQLHVILKQGDPAIAEPLAATTDQAFFQLLDALRRIRGKMSNSIEFSKTALKVKKILDGQMELSRDDIRKAEDEIKKDLLHIRFQPLPEAVELGTGKTQKVTLKLRMPNTITVDPSLRFEIPVNSGLKISPADVKLKDDAKEASFDLTAGTTAGTYFIKVNPSQGDAIDLKVVVK